MAKYTPREFQVGEYYLSKRGNSPAWYRTWYCEQSKQTRRSSLGTADFEEAKLKLTEWYISEVRSKTLDIPEAEITLAEIINIYMEEHGKNLRSGKSIVIFFRYWLDFWGDASVQEIRNSRKQEEFQAHLFAKGLAHNSVNRVLEMGRAALNRAWKRGTIANVPYILTLPVKVDKPKGRPVEPEEIAHLYNHCADHIRLFIELMIGTAGRSEAVCQLTWQQIDFQNNLIHLNPEGREQTNKRRPTVKLPPFNRERLIGMDRSTRAIIMFRGEKVGKVLSGWRKALGRADMDREITPYSLRHTVARWLRKEGVPPWEVAMQLGHKLEGYSMTERYAAWSPDYLEHSVVAIDKLLRLSIPENAPMIVNAR